MEPNFRLSPTRSSFVGRPACSNTDIPELRQPNRHRICRLYWSLATARKPANILLGHILPTVHNSKRNLDHNLSRTIQLDWKADLRSTSIALLSTGQQHSETHNHPEYQLIRWILIRLGNVNRAHRLLSASSQLHWVSQL